MSAPDLHRVRCPTCRVEQEWSDTCRRCKSDLRLLRQVSEAYFRNQRRCLSALRAGRPRAALLAAQRCHALHPDEESRRLLAISALLGGDWATAAALGQDSPED